MKILTYEEWYMLYHSQKALEKIEKAYDILNENGQMNLHFDKEEFIEDVMTERYNSAVSESMGGSL